MNHNSGFIIGIALAKTLIKHTPKSHLKKHPSDPQALLYNDYRSPSKYQVKRKQYVYFSQN